MTGTNNKSYQNSTNYFDHIISEDIRDNIRDNTSFDLYDYMTSPNFAAWKLFPAQEFMVKIIAGRELDSKRSYIPIWDYKLETLYHTFTETEFLDYCWNEGMVSFKEQPDADKLAGAKWILALGRRSFKSALMASACGYQTLKYFQTKDPFEEYTMRPGAKVLIPIISTSLAQAGIIYDDLVTQLETIQSFSSYKPRILTKATAFKHPLQVEQIGWKKAKYHFFVRPMAGKAKVGLGFSAPILILDEAYNLDFSESSDMSLSMLIKKLSPLLSTFGDEAMTFIASNPGSDKSNHFCEIYKDSMENKESPYTSFRMPSWIVNLNPKYVRERVLARKTNRSNFDVEYGAKFGIHTGEKWLPPAHIELLNSSQGGARGSGFYFTGIDLGACGDAASVTTITPVDRYRLKVVSHKSFMAGKGDYIDKEVVPPRDYSDHVIKENELYRPQLILTDQFEALSFLSFLPYDLVLKMRDIHFNGNLLRVTMNILHDFITRQALIVNDPILLNSLKDLTPRKRRGTVVIESAGSYPDDPADSLARAVMAFILYIKSNPHMAQMINYSLDDCNSYHAYGTFLEGKFINKTSRNYQKSKAERLVQSMTRPEDLMPAPTGIAGLQAGETPNRNNKMSMALRASRGLINLRSPNR